MDVLDLYLGFYGPFMSWTKIYWNLLEMQLRSVQDLGKDIEMANWVGYYRVFTEFRCEVPKADRFYWVFTEFRGRPKYSIVITLVMEKKSFTLNEFLLGFELKKKQKTKMRYRVLPSFAGNQKTNVECNVAK